MIIDLPNTNTSAVARALASARENYSLATGRVLTLLVAVDGEDEGSIDATLSTLRSASFEHPARVLVLISGDPQAQARLDAQLLVAADAGASEVVVMRLRGPLTTNLDSVVTPLLLPDTPVVACWPQLAPAHPAREQLGRIAQRRITNARRDPSAPPLTELGYEPGDSDMMWSLITPWRGIVASALDRYPGRTVTGAEISGAAGDASVDLAAGWLASSLGVDVVRGTAAAAAGFPIAYLALHCDGGDVEVSVQGGHTVKISVPGRADSFVAMGERSDAECLAEDLRHLGPDATYGRALAGLARVHQKEQ